MKSISKILAVTAILATGTVATTFASNNTISAISEENKKVEITAAELPIAVQDDVKASFSGATIEKAYKVVDDAGAITGYEVSLQKDGKSMVATYDAKGIRLTK